MDEEILSASFLTDEEADKLFSSEEDYSTEEENDKENKDITEETDDSLENVGNENEDIQEEEDTRIEDEGSPSNASSIARALQEVGVLQTLDNDRLSSIQSAEDFADAIEEEVQNRLEEHNKRIDEALRYKVPIPLVQEYENTIKTLDSITEEMIEDENNERYRKNIIYQDLINKGHSEEDAKELVEEYVENGKDIVKAKKALDSCKNFYKKNYEELIKKHQNEYKESQRRVREQSELLKKSILEDEKLFTDLNINKATRQKIYETVAKPIETLEDGTKINALQKYIIENPVDFNKNVGMLYVLTDGFTNIDKFIKGPVKKEVKKNMNKLDNVLSNSSIGRDGSFTFKSGISSNKNATSLSLDDWKLV